MRDANGHGYSLIIVTLGQHRDPGSRRMAHGKSAATHAIDIVGGAPVSNNRFSCGSKGAKGHAALTVTVQNHTDYMFVRNPQISWSFTATAETKSVVDYWTSCPYPPKKVHKKVRPLRISFLLRFPSFFKEKFRRKSFLWGHWHPCSGLLVTYPGFQRQDGSLACVSLRGTEWYLTGLKCTFKYL